MIAQFIIRQDKTNTFGKQSVKESTVTIFYVGQSGRSEVCGSSGQNDSRGGEPIQNRGGEEHRASQGSREHLKHSEGEPEAGGSVPGTGPLLTPTEKPPSVGVKMNTSQKMKLYQNFMYTIELWYIYMFV